MPRDDQQTWMLAEAIERLAKAERLRQHFFQLRHTEARRPTWEPPVDVIETESEALIIVALPGVDPEQVEAALEDGYLIVAGRRVLPPELRTAVIHRLELPQGNFERRVPLPPGRYSGVRRFAANGCLVFGLEKAI